VRAALQRLSTAPVVLSKPKRVKGEDDNVATEQGKRAAEDERVFMSFVPHASHTKTIRRQ
jgi:hypothetical protein